jgi:recombination protein RecR
MKELKPILKLMESFHQLPGIGMKTAERLAHAILTMSDDDVITFSEALKEVKHAISACQECGLLTDSQPCEICQSHRPYDVFVVISYPRDVYAFERLDEPTYRYHVLGGVLSPAKGFKADDLKIDALIERIKKHGIKEIIIATNPTLEGETTAQYIAALLQKLPVQVTRLGYGLPMGSQVDYADTLTLSRALSGRTKIKGD